MKKLWNAVVAVDRLGSQLKFNGNIKN